MAYTFNYTTIGSGLDQNYLDELKTTLTPQVVYGGVSANYTTVIPNIKNRITLNLLKNLAVVDDAQCGWTPKPSNKYVGLDQRILDVEDKEIKDALCPKDFEQLYLGMYMESNEEIPFVKIIGDSYVKKAAKFNEGFVWDGTATYNGWLKQLVTDGTTISARDEVNAETTYIGRVNAMIAKATPEILSAENKVMFCSFGFFNSYANELRAANNYMLANTEYKNGSYSMTIAGTDIKLVATASLDNLTYTTLATHTEGGSTVNDYALVLTTKENLVIGTDGMNDEETAKIWFSVDNDEIRVHLGWKIGCSYYWGEQAVISYKTA